MGAPASTGAPWRRLAVLGELEAGLLGKPFPLGHAERLLAPAHRPPAEPPGARVVVEGAGRAAEHAVHLAHLAAVEERLGDGLAVAVNAADRQPAVAVADGGGADRNRLGGTTARARRVLWVS